MLSVHVELHDALEQILALLGRCHLAHHAVQELLLMFNYKLIALYDGGARVKSAEFGAHVAYLQYIY